MPFDELDDDIWDKDDSEYGEQDYPEQFEDFDSEEAI